jgi:hypothetical protein
VTLLWHLTVVVSGICPRLNDKDGHISAGNRILSKIAHEENLYFVDNDSFISFLCCEPLVMSLLKVGSIELLMLV